MKPRKLNTVIFAGAGASTAVNFSKFPTTVEFYRVLKAEIKNNPLFQFVENHIKKYDKEKIDIEKILWLLGEMYEFYGIYYRESSIARRSMSSNIIQEFVPSAQLSSALGLFDTMSIHISSLMDLINEQLYEHYSYDPSSDELVPNWLYLLSLLSRPTIVTNIFTTNYDAVIEGAVSELHGDDLLYKMIGAEGARRKKIDLKRWGRDPEDENPLITKLHGSLDWNVKGEDIFLGSAVFTGDHKKHAIVYPGFKGKTGPSFFSNFHRYLSSCLSIADIFIVIGFAFRDDYINEIIRQNMNKSAKIFIINPTKVSFPRNGSKPVNIIGGFGKESIDLLKFELRDDLLR